MDRRDWTPPAQTGAGSPSTEDGATQPDVARWTARFVVSMVFFGILSAVFSSRFPICLGVVLFITDEEFVAWAFESFGIRLVPDTVGAIFIKCIVFLIGWSILAASWKDAAPSWLSQQLPPGLPSWSVIAGSALAIAAISVASSALTTTLLPEIKRGSTTWTTTRIVIGLIMCGMLLLFAYAFRPLQERVTSELSHPTRILRASSTCDELA